MSVDLTKIDAEDLINELKLRYDASIFVGVYHSEEGSRDEFKFLSYHGGGIACLGLLRYADVRIATHLCEDTVHEGE